ncbi:class I SAM-dependent methyltransferase [Methylibium sp.]|uniref:class I SAM-dependent methyltransferase n=1 Tax=Methylibium sp. TaxID=2067992 RepID=UPI002DBD8278|nr:class I SAM-dependent methyltransferase [Methylibium sp.]
MPTSRRLWLSAAVAILAPFGSGLRAAELYENGPASLDGIGKRYMGREISGVMGWQGAGWLEREEREREERTDVLLRLLQLSPGMVVADIGAGTGYLARRMAAQVRPGGQVLAVDVQPQMLRMLEKLSREPGLELIKPSLGAPDDVRLAAGTVDLAIMVDVYHELAFPKEVLASIRRALKPTGRLVFVEYRAEDPKVPIKPLHKMSEAQVRREAEANGFAWQATRNDLPWQHFIVFGR